jgi:signal transduction histidine kinase
MLEMRLDPTTKKMFSKYIRRIEHESDRIIEILEGIMLAGRNFSGIERFNPRPVNAHKLIRSSVREYAQAAVHEQKPLLQVNGPERMVVMYPQFIEYVIHNLLRNAYMYDPDKQPPLVVMEYGPAELQVQVKDRGIGIPDKEIDKVFESFYRASNIHTVPGMGLGLVLAKQFIELHNGKISVKSTEGEGTTVSFSIPYVQDPVRPGFSPNKTHSSAQPIKA